MELDFLIQLLVNGFIIGLLYGVVAMAFVLIYKSSLVVNFAQGRIFTSGSMGLLVVVGKVFFAILFSFYFHLNFYDHIWNLNSTYYS